MARYNTSLTTSSIAATGTVSTPAAGILTKFTGTTYAVTIPDPTIFKGVTQSFYNAASGSITLTSPSGTFTGPGGSAASTQVMITNSSLTLGSDGTNYVILSEEGGPLVGTTGTFSDTLTANGNMTFGDADTDAITINAQFVTGSQLKTAKTAANTLALAAYNNTSSTYNSLVTLTAGLTPTVAITSGGVGTIDNINIGSTTRGTGNFTSIGAGSAGTGAFTTLTSNNATTFTRNGQGTTTTDAAHTLLVTGGMGVSGTLYTAGLTETSSIVFKENIAPIDNALETVLQLFGVTYDRKDTNEHEAGLIAEQVYKIAPDLVSLDSNGKPHGIKYTKISAYLIESIKTLQQEIEKLKGNK
jgi:hypothetical protein